MQISTCFWIIWPMVLDLALSFPVGINNCGLRNWIDKPPSRAVTMNQGATEILLALNLSSRMVGTAYLDDEIWPEFKDAYSNIPVIAKLYPDITTLMALKPDFIFGSYASSFETTSKLNYSQYLGKCKLGIFSSSLNRTRFYCREELHSINIDTYLQVFACENVTHRPKQISMDILFKEIWDIAYIFDVQEAARKLIDNIDNHIDRAEQIIKDGNARLTTPSALTAVWLDSWHDKNPFVGACCGSPNLIIEKSGAKNILFDLGLSSSSTWAAASWEQISDRDPDVIILIDADWDPADTKLLKLCNHSLAKNLRAVKNRAFVTVPFSGSTLGARNGATAFNLAEAMVALARNQPLNPDEFTMVSLTADSNVGKQVTSSSGVKLYSKLPIVQGIDLDLFCPGLSKLAFERPAKKSDGSTSLHSGAIAGIVVGVLLAALALSLSCFFLGKKQGYATLRQDAREQSTQDTLELSKGSQKNPSATLGTPSELP